MCFHNCPINMSFRWMPQDFPDDYSTLVQVMSWCRNSSVLATELLQPCLQLNPKSLNVMQSRKYHTSHIEGLVQDCCNSSALATELLEPCFQRSSKPNSKWLNVMQSLNHTITVSWLELTRSSPWLSSGPITMKMTIAHGSIIACEPWKAI